jgi:hypothetical protein
MYCKWCGESTEKMLDITGYDWDAAERGDEMALSIQRVLGHQCANRTACARRIVAQGTNVEALRMVAQDYENLGQLAVQAREILNEYAELSRQIARHQDQTARENGWGAIGGPNAQR